MTTHLSIDNLRGPSMRGSSSHAASAHLSWDGAEAAAATAAERTERTERTGVIGGYRGRSESHAAAHHGDIPRNEDDITHYILYDGLPQSGPHVQHARERQADAYLHFTHRIHERVEAAHAVVLSANPLSLSVMASQLRMYRWRVTETQTLLETTSVLQDYVVDVAKHGYRVRRRPAAPFGQSRYAYGRGKSALKRIAQEERAKLAGKQVGGGSSSSHGAHTTTSVSNSHGSTPSAKTKAADSTLASRQASNRSSRADGGRAVANAAAQPSAAAAAADSARPSLYSTAAASAMGDDDHPQQRSDEEDEEEAEEEEAADRLRREEDRLPLPAPDALPRLVLVDGFTHEDFADIARHIRFVDHEHGLDLLLILLLPADPAAAAAATQGAGCVVTPQHETTLADAYAAGYDLVLAHGMDNLLVDFLTSAFVSSVGRWRNDVRSKAAVGNYMSVRNVLLGGLDTASLQQLVWDDNTDDARVLELLGAQSLAVHGDSKRYGEVSRKLLGQPQTQQQQQQQLESMAIHRGDPLSAAISEGNSAATTEANDYGGGSNSSITNHRSSGSQASEKSTRLRHVASTVMSHVPRLRSRPASVAHFGVRLPADAQHAQMPMTSFGKTQDVLGGIMAPVTAAGGGQRGGADGGHSGRRGHRRRGLGDVSGSADGDDEEDDDSSVSDLFTDDALRDPQMLQTALEKEMGRLMAENEGKQSSINALQEEVAGLQRMVAVMKRQQTGHSNHNNSGGEDGDLASSGGLRSGDRPDSGSVVQLAKQQQIFLLKERLEAANDHIAALLRDGRSSSILANGKAAPGARGRGGGGAGGLVGVGRLGGRLASGSGAAFAASVTTARRGVGGSGGNSGSQRGATAAAERFRRRAYEAYQSAREGEVMGLLDEDADIANAALQRLSQEAGAGASVVALSNSVTQRREQEATDSVLRSLQDDLRFLQGGLDKSGAARHQSDDDKHSSEVAALQARMATHLQAAVERLEAERQRVRHLEQLRQTDQLLLAHAARMTEHVRRRGAAAAGSRDSAGGDSSSSGSDDDDDEEEDGDGVSSSGNRRSREQHGGKSRAGGATKKREKGAKGAAKVGGAAAVATAGGRKAGAAGADGGKKAAAGEGKGKGSAARKKTKAGRTSSSSRGGAVRTGRAVDDETIEVAEVEGLIAAAVTDAVASRNRVFRRQLTALVQTCKSQLARVVLKHQKPRTVAYMQLLEEELAQAKRDQRGAFLRLRFTLTHLRPDQYDESCIPPPPLPQPPHVDGSSVESQAAASLTSETSHAASTAMQDDAGEGAEGEDDGAAPAMIPLRAVTDPDVRQAAERIAREHAAFALRVAYMSEELQRVRAAHAAETEPAAAAATAGDAMEKTLPPHSPSSSSSAPSPSHSRTPVQLLRAYRKATQHVRAAVEGVEPVQRYLDAVLAEMEAEQRLSPWCDVDCAQLFQGLPELSSAWAGNATVSPGSGLALVPTHLQYAAYPSPEEFTLHLADESMPLLLADVDGSVRDVAGLYGVLLQSCVSMADDCHGDDGYDNGRFGFGGDSVIHASSGGGGRLTPAATASGEGECGAAGLGKRVPAEGLGGGHGHRSSTESAEGTRTAVRPRLTVTQALAQLPVEASAVAQYQGQLGRLYAAEGACSATQLRLYEAVLRAYQQHQINPLHMAAVEAAVLYTASSGSAKSAASAFAEAGSSGGQRTHLHVAHAQHHEVLTTLQLLSPTSAAASSSSSSSSSSSAFRLLVQQVCRQQRALEQELTAPPHMVSKGRLVVTPCTSAAFLNALDAALLGCVVDELRWRQLRRVADEDGAVVAALVAARSAGASRGSGGLFPPSSASTAPSMADAEWDEGRHESAPPPRIVAHYAAFCAAHARNAAQGGDAAQLDGAAADMFDLSAFSVTSQGSADAYAQLAALFPGGIPGAASGGGGGGGGRSTAQQLAALFSRQGGEAAAAAQLSGSAAGGGMTAEAEAALLRGIYLSDASADKGSGGGDAGDDNAQAIRRLRMELEYMDALRKQRIDELALRCGWSAQQRQEMFGDSVAGSYDGRGDYFASSTTAGAAAAAGGGYPDIDPDRLKFEVKSGTSAWYGMEAAKRVRAILRRRALPDQIIVGGGPDGGGVGIELSRRTAEPATAAPATPPPPLSSDGNEAAKRADTGAAGEGSAQPHRGHPSPPLLPPIRPSGVSGTQPQQRVEARQHDAAPLPYISPRDALSLSAYGNLVQTSDPHNRGSSSSGAAYAYDHVHDGGSDLQQRVMAYRAELTRAAGRLSPSSTATYADGAPYCLPLASPPPPNTQPGAATGGLRPRPPLPQQTSWVYGVPASSAASLVDQQSGVDPQQPRDTLLFMPPKPFSPMAEAAVRGAARVAPRFPSASSASSSAFTTPAAMAAQRLQTMLMASMVDPAVVTSPPRQTVPRSSAPATASAAAVSTSPPTTPRRETRAGRTEGGGGRIAAGDEEAGQQREQPHQLDSTIGPETELVVPEYDKDA